MIILIFFIFVEWVDSIASTDKDRGGVLNKRVLFSYHGCELFETSIIISI